MSSYETLTAFQGIPTLRFVEIAMSRDSDSKNQQFFQDLITKNGYDPNHFVSNALKLSIQCIVRETHWHLPRVRVLSVLYYADQLLDEAYGEKVFEGSGKTGHLTGWKYAKMLLEARMEYEETIMTKEHSTYDGCDWTPSKPLDNFECYNELEELKKIIDYPFIQF